MFNQLFICCSSRLYRDGGNFSGNTDIYDCHGWVIVCYLPDVTVLKHGVAVIGPGTRISFIFSRCLRMPPPPPLLLLLLNAAALNSLLIKIIINQLGPSLKIWHSVSPRHNLSFGSRAFRVSAPKVWNSLPLHIRQSESLSTFRRHLKTHYFQLAYPAT